MIYLLIYGMGFLGLSVTAGLLGVEVDKAFISATLWPLLILLIILYAPYALAYRFVFDEWP